MLTVLGNTNTQTHTRTNRTKTVHHTTLGGGIINNQRKMTLLHKLQLSATNLDMIQNFGYTTISEIFHRWIHVGKNLAQAWLLSNERTIYRLATKLAQLAATKAISDNVTSHLTQRTKNDRYFTIHDCINAEIITTKAVTKWVQQQLKIQTDRQTDRQIANQTQCTEHDITLPQSNIKLKPRTHDKQMLANMCLPTVFANKSLSCVQKVVIGWL